jgi:hypothetical protein
MRQARRLFSVFSLAVLVTVVALGFQPLTTDARSGPPDDLEALNQRLLSLFELNGVVYTDADETSDRLVVGVSNRGIETSVMARLAALGVPAELVDVVQAPEIHQVDSLQTGVFRPVLAGVQIHFSNYLCSVGFNAVRNGVQGFVTASHCTTQQGGVEGTEYYQPLSSTAPTSIGTEIADPDYKRGGGCPIGRVCRYSDSAFVRYENGASGLLGGIAKTSGPNNGSLDSIGNFTITSEGSAGMGATVNKVGRSSGWTAAPVTATCANIGVSGTNIVQRCQTLATSSGNVIVKGGDSGSPVFTTSGGNTTLVGVLWGGSTDGTLFVYSPIANIEMSSELGQLTTYGSGNTEPATLLSITVDPASASIGVTGTQQFTAMGQYDNGSTADITDGVTWSTEDSGIATISASGLATGVAAGNTSVSATLGSIGGTASLSVTDSPPPSSGTAISVQSITYVTSGGRDNDKHLEITLVVRDDNDAPVSGASVSIDLYRDFLRIASGTADTGPDGTVTFTLHNASSGTYHTEVIGLSAAGLEWDGATPSNSFSKP